MDGRTDRGLATLESRRPFWRRRLVVLLSLGVVLGLLVGRIAFEMAFDLGGTGWQMGTVAGWWHPPGGPGGGSRYELLYFDMRRSGSGPLFDTTEWSFTLTRNDILVPHPDPAMLARARTQIEADVASGVSIQILPDDRFDPRPVALDLFSRGRLTGVVVDRRARAWNIVHGVGLVLAAAAVIHLLAALAMTIHDRHHRGARRVAALSRLHAAVLLSSCILLPVTGVLWVFWWRMPDPWWVFTFAPLAMLAIVLLVCLPAIAARLRRASLADDLLCTACLYDLRDLPDAGRCPECGQEYERRATVEAWRAVRKQDPV